MRYKYQTDQLLGSIIDLEMELVKMKFQGDLLFL